MSELEETVCQGLHFDVKEGRGGLKWGTTC